jgi:hypothetical protein
MFFIFFSAAKVKYFLLIMITKLILELVDFTRIRDFTWRMPDCEELVGVTHRRWEVGHFVEIDHTNGDPLEAPRFSNRRVLIRSAVTGRSSACWPCLDVHDTLLIKN